MAAQLDLDFEPLATVTNEGKAVAVSPNHVEWLLGKLRHGKWMKSRELGALTESQKRRLRLIARATGGAVVSWPGSPGYKLLNDCTLEELRHGDRAMRSQLREMAGSWKVIWRRMHALELAERGAV